MPGKRRASVTRETPVVAAARESTLVHEMPAGAGARAVSSVSLGAAAEIAPSAPARHEFAVRVKSDLVNGQDVGGGRDAPQFDHLQPDVPVVVLFRDQDHASWLTSGQLKYVGRGPPGRFHAAKLPRPCVVTIAGVAGSRITRRGGSVPGAAAWRPAPSLGVIHHIRMVVLFDHVASLPFPVGPAWRQVRSRLQISLTSPLGRRDRRPA